MKPINNKTLQQPTEHIIYNAADHDIKTVSEILARAFTYDPVLNWLCNKPAIYSTFFRAEAEALYKKHPYTYINQQKTAAAMWLPPGIIAKPNFYWRLLAVLWKLACHGGLSSLKRGCQLDTFLAERHISEPHFYLRAIGIDPNHQGQGIGSALLKTGLKACDQAGMPAYLESTNERNNPLYERFGFTITAQQSLPDNGPTFWFMKREAQR